MNTLFELGQVMTFGVVALVITLWIVRSTMGYRISSRGVVLNNDYPNVRFEVMANGVEYRMTMIHSEEEKEATLVNGELHVFYRTSSRGTHNWNLKLDRIGKLGTDGEFYQSLFSNNLHRHWSFTSRKTRDGLRNMILDQLETLQLRHEERMLKRILEQQSRVVTMQTNRPMDPLEQIDRQHGTK